MLTLLLALSATLAADGRPQAHDKTAVVQALRFGAITEQQARELQGRRVRFVAEPCNTTSKEDGFLTYECHGLGGISRTLFLYPPAPDTLPEQVVVEVEAVLVVIRHPKTTTSPGFTEFRLTHGRLVR